MAGCYQTKSRPLEFRSQARCGTKKFALGTYVSKELAEQAFEYFHYLVHCGFDYESAKFETRRVMYEKQSREIS